MFNALQYSRCKYVLKIQKNLFIKKLNNTSKKILQLTFQDFIFFQ